MKKIIFLSIIFIFSSYLPSWSGETEEDIKIEKTIFEINRDRGLEYGDFVAEERGKDVEERVEIEETLFEIEKDDWLKYNRFLSDLHRDFYPRPVPFFPEYFFDKTDAFVPSLRVTQEYDDNIQLNAGPAKEASWKTNLAPSIKFRFPWDQTFLAVSYTPSFILYYNRDDKLDLNHDAQVDLRHEFGPRLTVGVKDDLLRKEDPEDIRPNVGVFQENADYWKNDAVLNLSYNLTRRIYLLLGYTNTWIKYDKKIMADSFDRLSHDGEAGVSYQPNPYDSLDLTYRYRYTDYDVNPSDYYSNLLTVGGEHRFGKHLTAKLRGGYEIRDYRSGDNLENPYVEAILEYIFSPRFKTELWYWYKTEDTFEFDYRGLRVHGVQGKVVYYFTPKTFLTVSARGEFNRFPSRASKEEPQSRSEDFYSWGANIAHEIKTDLFLEVGYKYSKSDSEFPGDSYQRNQYYAGFNYFF